MKNKRTGNQENILPLIHTTKNLFKSRKNTNNKRLATKIVPDWELKVVVSIERSPYGLLLTGGSREGRLGLHDKGRD